MKTQSLLAMACAVVIGLCAGGCAGADGSSCSVTDNGDGTHTIDCEDGTSTTISDGMDGMDGASCMAMDNGDGTKTISCEDGTSVTVSDGEDGMDGADGSACSATDNGDGTYTISCEDGTSVTVSDGMDGTDASSCSVTDNGDGTYTISCEDSGSVTVLPAATDEVTFPDSGDTRMTAESDGIYFWNDGDYVEGTRTTSVPTLVRVNMTLEIGENSLGCGETQDGDFMVNGTTVGSFSVEEGDSQVVETFSVPSLSGPDYTFRIETTRTVAPGCGAATYPNGVSTLQLVGLP
jgi:hypothetical protein